MIAEDEGAPPLGRLALSQIEVRSAPDGKNIAPGAKVTASASLEEGPWAAAALVDGAGLPGSNPRATATLLLRREFPVAAGLRRALLFVCGLGYYTLSVNGAAVGAEDLLKPGWTDYAKTCLYDTRDITAHLRAGAPNAIGLTLANGMYNVQYAHGRYTKFTGPPRAQKALLQLRLEYDGGRVETLVSDPRWKTAPGPVVFEHAYGGEDYDAALEPRGWDRPGYDDSAWTHAVETAGPGGRPAGFSHASPPIRAHELLKPAAVRELRPGVAVHDFGQNLALMPVLRVRGPKGASVKLRPAELLHPDGSIDWRSTHNSKAEAAWNYRLAGDPEGETWAPDFFYHGARYLQVEVAPPETPAPADAAPPDAPAPPAAAPPENAAPAPAPAGLPALPVVERLEARVVHSDSPAIGHFACSDPLLNRIRALVRNAQRSNMAHVLTDCPHRERLGWLEQDHLNGHALRSEFDLTRLFAKILGDIEDAQLENGMLPSIAPEYIRFEGAFRDSPEWGGALVLAAWQHFVWTGDDTPLHRRYPAMRRYFDYLARRAAGRILSHGLGDWCDLGPAGSGHSALTPVPLVATATYYETALTLERIAQHLRRPADARRYAEHADEIAEAFNARFLDPATALYGPGSQTAQALPLALGLVPFGQQDAVFARLLQALRAAGGGITTGEIGHPRLLRALTQAGRADLVYAIHRQTERPGYGYQLARGATSLIEAWDANPRVSQNHFMLGHITEWLYQSLAGLAPDPSAPGFARMLIAPEPVPGVDWAEASIDTVRGRATVRWERAAGAERGTASGAAHGSAAAGGRGAAGGGTAHGGGAAGGESGAAHGERKFILRVTVPPNARAGVRLPVPARARITESGRATAGRDDLAPLGMVDGRPAYELGAGEYAFEAVWQE
ncbi:MAG: glycoside hydrolase family 78 protein [Opitutaceae bacterium]|nr:glycoside hydrolase family 78 protein [Opitutaceae bacterium]